MTAASAFTVCIMWTVKTNMGYVTFCLCIHRYSIECSVLSCSVHKVFQHHMREQQDFLYVEQDFLGNGRAFSAVLCILLHFFWGRAQFTWILLWLHALLLSSDQIGLSCRAKTDRWP